MVIFLALTATFICHQQISIYSSKYFLVNVWNGFYKCDINFIFKRGTQNDTGFNLGIVEFRNQELSMTHLLSAAASGGRFVV
jgi:hypothetical protein